MLCTVFIHPLRCIINTFVYFNGTSQLVNENRTRALSMNLHYISFHIVPISEQSKQGPRANIKSSVRALILSLPPPPPPHLLKRRGRYRVGSSISSMFHHFHASFNSCPSLELLVQISFWASFHPQVQKVHSLNHCQEKCQQ